jgi:hypothetical protein
MAWVSRAPTSALLVANALDAYTHPGMVQEYVDAIRASGKAARSLIVAETYGSEAPHGYWFLVPSKWTDVGKNDTAAAQQLLDHSTNYLKAKLSDSGMPGTDQPVISFGYSLHAGANADIAVSVRGGTFPSLNEAPYGAKTKLSQSTAAGGWADIGEKRLDVWISGGVPRARKVWSNAAPTGAQVRASLEYDTAKSHSATSSVE